MFTDDGGSKTLHWAPAADPGADYSTHAIAVPKLPAGKPVSASVMARYVVKDRHGVVTLREAVPMTRRAIDRAFVEHFGFPDVFRDAACPL